MLIFKNNTKMQIRFALSFLILFVLFAFLARELLYAKPSELPSALIGEDIPAFHLSQLYQSDRTFTEQNMIGQVSLLNIWATWCYACKLEQPMLMKIKNQYHIPIFGIAYKDDSIKAKQWLKEFGNPYSIIGNDTSGDIAIDLGVYGTPETFVIDKRGKIVYRHVGVIDEQTWNTVLYPLIKKYQDLA